MTKELKSIIGTVKKNYPEDEDLWIELYTDIPMGLAGRLDTEDDTSAGFEMIKGMVKDWNFADADGTELTIDDEGVNKLPASLASWIANEISDLIKPDAEKKKE